LSKSLRSVVHLCVSFFNPILHTTWLNNHALTLKRNTAKYYFGEKSSILHTFLKNLLWIKENLSQTQKLFNFNAISVLKNLPWTVWNSRCTCMVQKPSHILMLSLGVVTEPVLWVIRLPPPPTTGSPSPYLYGSITFTHLKENSSMVKLPYLC
jgi:hypothetical protein